MLVEFTVKNYRSIREEQTLSMAKAKGGELEESNSFTPDAPGSAPLLRSAVIYGPNAAGKTNLIKAMATMEAIVQNSASSSQEGDDIPVTPFLFDEISQNKPTEFEVIFISEGVRYQYGFAAKKTHVVEEWLIAYPKGRPQRWFSRTFNEKSKDSDYSFGAYLLGQKAVWEKATRNNALFLSTAVQLNSEQLKPVFGWFKNSLIPTNAGRGTTGFTLSLCEGDDESEKLKVINLLKSVDLHIHDIEISKEKFDPTSLPEEIRESLREKVIQDLVKSDLVSVKTIHKTSSGNLVSLDFEEESSGTKRFFSFAGPWIKTLEDGYILIIDELNQSLHPDLVKYLVDLFHNSETNPGNAQLIFTTHETSILDQGIFRRDQVWFCEKDTSQATDLFPLTDFRPRKGRENLESGYLSGRYGARPFINPLYSRGNLGDA